MEQKLSVWDQVLIPAMQMPAFRSSLAQERGVHKKFLMTTWGGLGDQVCAEPTLRYALKHFPDCEISLATDRPELFTHLNFRDVIPFSSVSEKSADDYMVINTITSVQDLTWQFFSHLLVNPVDFASQCAFRLQIPISEKTIELEHGFASEPEVFRGIDLNRAVIVHAGKHWASKTFPKVWWDDVLKRLRNYGALPVLIGKTEDDPVSGNVGTVDVDTAGCVDLRNRTSIKELIWLLQKARVVLTNDSSPIHIAASGTAWIGFIASCKHPDFISHWRRNFVGSPHWSWRMENLGLDGIWNHINLNPSPENNEEISVESLPEGLMEKILPEPNSVALWTRDKLLFG